MISIGWAVMIGVGGVLAGFMVCAGVSLGKLDALESAVAWLLNEPESEDARENARAVLRG